MTHVICEYRCAARMDTVTFMMAQGIGVILSFRVSGYIRKIFLTVLSGSFFIHMKGSTGDKKVSFAKEHAFDYNIV